MGWDDSPTTSTSDIYFTGWDNNKISGWDNPVRIDIVDAFQFTVTTAGADTFQLPIYSGGTYNFAVDWGDGNSDTIMAYDDAAANHSYTGAGTFTVRIVGTITGWRFANAGDKDLIREIQAWGCLNLGNNESYFRGCSNLTITATDVLDLTNTTSMSSALRACPALTTVPSMNDWDVSSVTSMLSMFYQCTLFNQDISSWDTSSVTNMGSMFREATAFDQDISGWDVSNVANFSFMLRFTPFNQDISSWVVSSATTMQNMFRDATSFNQDLSGWTTTLLENTVETFRGAISFDQDLGGWDIADLTNASSMFLGVTLSTANYDALIIGWEGQTEKPNVTFHAGNSVLTLGGAAEAARDALVANGWTITDSTGVHT